MTAHLEGRIGSLIAGGGIIWIAQAATQNFTSFTNLLLPPGPLEACAVGILIWLHSKWRASVSVH